MLRAKTRRDSLDQAISELAGEPPFAELVGRLCCLRGIRTLTAFALTVELDWTRFRPQSLGPFLGLTPIGSRPAHISGDTTRRRLPCALPADKEGPQTRAPKPGCVKFGSARKSHSAGPNRPYAARLSPMLHDAASFPCI